MFFILGSPRSGTTLLAQCINAHSEIIVPHETDFIVPIAYILNRVSDPTVGRQLIRDLVIRSDRFASHIGEWLSREEVSEIVADAPYDAQCIDRLFSGLARKVGKRFGGDKSPNDLLSLRILVQQGVLASGVKVIHLIRDVRDVMESLHRQHWVDDLDGYFPRMWANNNLYLQEVFRDSADYLFLRYEDFVNEPEIHLQRICSLLQVSFEPTMLDSERRDGRYRTNPAHTNLYQPVTNRHIGQHRGRIPAALLESYERQAREALERFGYLSSAV